MEKPLKVDSRPDELPTDYSTDMIIYVTFMYQDI